MPRYYSDKNTDTVSRGRAAVGDIISLIISVAQHELLVTTFTSPGYYRHSLAVAPNAASALFSRCCACCRSLPGFAAGWLHDGLRAIATLMAAR